MITPPQKDGALFEQGLFIAPSVVAGDGSRVILTSIQCFAGPSCTANRKTEGVPFAFTRTSGGWVGSSLAPPATQFAPTSTYRSLSADTGMALFSIATAPAGEDDLYAREPDGSFVDIGPTNPPATGPLGQYSLYGTFWATADYSHVAFNASLAAQWPFDETNGGGSIEFWYEYVGAGNAQPVLVGVSGGLGSTDLVSRCGTVVPASEGSMSADGRTVFFMADSCASGSGVNAGVPVPARALYARIDESRTVLLSGRSPLECTGVCASSPPGAAEFQGASVDGSRAFFVSTQQLTDRASEDERAEDSAAGSSGACAKTTGVNGCNLYEYDSSAPAGRGLVAVSAGDVSGGGPRVQGVMAVSADGSHVYFVAKGVLSTVANSAGRVAQDGADNLYVFERDGSYPQGRVAFVATLPGFGEKETEQWLEGRTSNVSPDGRFLVFTSYGLLTADGTSTTGAAQLFRYDAQTSELIRISIGERGFNDNGNAGAGDANIVAAARSDTLAGGGRRDPTMSDDGSFVFFDSPVGLTPRALNDVQIGSIESGPEKGPVYAQNVYEWHEGHVYLISDGRDTSYVTTSTVRLVGSVEVIGASASGRDVFFSTADRLVAQDTDTQLDYYDARTCTVSEPCVSAPPAALPCQGEACHGVPEGAPSLAAPVSTALSGAGNIPAAAKPVAKAKKKPRAKRPRRRRRRRGAARTIGHAKRGRK
jgi:hypothetical protein